MLLLNQEVDVDFVRMLMRSSSYNDLIIGCCSMKLSDGYLYNLEVNRKFQRQGIATRLIKECMKFRKGKRVWLETRNIHTEACALYDKLGFKIIARQPSQNNPAAEHLTYELEGELCH